MKAPNLVECKTCSWRLQQGSFDPRKKLCTACNNSRLVIDPKENLCNLCGETMCPIGTEFEQIPHGLYEAQVEGGYTSYHLSDMVSYTFSFCEKCLRNLFMQCKIKPLIEDNDIDYLTQEELWYSDQKYYEYRLWKDNGGHHQAYLDRKCNQRKDCPNTAIYSVLISKEFSENCSCEDHKERWQNTINASLVKFIPNVLKAFL